VHPSEREDERFATGENERCAVAMALTGAIARGGSTKFGPRELMMSMVMDIDEVETDAPRRGLEEHLSGLSSESVVDCIFELVVIDGGKPLKDAIAARCIGCLVTDIVDGGLFDGCMKDCCPGVIGVEGSALDPLNREWCQVLKR
jgi:hypothetical protein